MSSACRAAHLSSRAPVCSSGRCRGIAVHRRRRSCPMGWCMSDGLLKGSVSTRRPGQAACGRSVRDAGERFQPHVTPRHGARVVGLEHQRADQSYDGVVVGEWGGKAGLPVEGSRWPFWSPAITRLTPRRPRSAGARKNPVRGALQVAALAQFRDCLPNIPRKAHSIRQGSLRAPQPHRDHGRLLQGLASHRNPVPPMP